MTSLVPRAPVLPAAARLVLPVSTLSALMLAALAASAQPVLPPIIVTASRFADDADRLPFGVSVVTSQQIRDAGVVTVNEALMKLLGVPGRLDLNGGGDYVLDLRGFGVTADNNQVVIVDGVRLSEADLGGTRLAGIPIESVDTIEVIRGNAAVLYGEGATAGAIVINTKAASDKVRKSSGTGYLAMGSDSLLDARGGATLTTGGFSLDASLNQRTTHGHRENFRSSSEGRGLSAQWRNEWLRIGARHAQDELRTGLPGALDAAQYASDPLQASTPTDWGHIQNLRNGVFANATFGAWQLGVDAGHRRKLLESMGIFGLYAYNIEAKNRGVKVRHSAPIGTASNALTAGFERNEWLRVNPGFASTAEQSSDAYYLKDDLSLQVGTVLSAGVRRERVTKTNSSSPAAGIDDAITAWDVGAVVPVPGVDRLSAYARIGRSFRFANADEFSYTSPSAALLPQTSRDAELGWRLGWASGRGDLRFYRSALRHEIGFDPVATDPFGGTTGANVNFDPTLRQGAELELQQQLDRRWELRLNAAARQAKFTDGPHDGKRIALTPRYTASLGIDWKPAERHRLGALLNTVSSQSPDVENTCRMPAYTLAGLRYAFTADQVELGFGVNNLADRKYYTQAFSCANGSPSAIYPEAGRSVVLSVRVTL